MVAVAFGYSSYRYSRFNFLDFSQLTLYEKLDVFAPKADEYILIFYSSKQTDLSLVTKKINAGNTPILAIDFAQNVRQSSKELTVITGGFNELLKVVHKMRVTHLPSALYIKKERNALYKQNSSFLML